MTMPGDLSLRRPDPREFPTIGMGVFVALSFPAALRRGEAACTACGTPARLTVGHAKPLA